MKDNLIVVGIIAFIVLMFVVFIHDSNECERKGGVYVYRISECMKADNFIK